MIDNPWQVCRIPLTRLSSLAMDNEKVQTQSVHEEAVQEGSVRQLSVAHRDYLLQRHGTIDLEPCPTADPADPLNWAEWRKNIYLALVAFHGFQAGFMAAGLVPAVGLMVVDYGKSPSAISYLVSSMVSWCYPSMSD